MERDRRSLDKTGLATAVWDDRQFHRVPSSAPATLLSTALGRVRATVTDLSQSGCRITTRARCHVGDRFVLKIDPIGPRLVRVVWVEGETVGLTFSDLMSWTAISQIVFGGPAEMNGGPAAAAIEASGPVPSAW